MSTYQSFPEVPGGERDIMEEDEENPHEAGVMIHVVPETGRCEFLLKLIFKNKISSGIKFNFVIFFYSEMEPHRRFRFIFYSHVSLSSKAWIYMYDAARST